jgi:hypothetical protein
MAQPLVLPQAIAAKEAGECQQALEEMQERFMVYNTRSPMNWIQKLRTCGKNICNTTTGLGHIVWSDDRERLSYIGLELSMTGLRDFISEQVKAAEVQLHSLLYSSGDSATSLPPLDLGSLKDNPAVSTAGWSFLSDPRNTALQGHSRWLLHRVVETDRLQEEFFTELASLTWRRPAVERYLSTLSRRQQPYRHNARSCSIILMRDGLAIFQLLLPLGHRVLIILVVSHQFLHLKCNPLVLRGGTFILTTRLSNVSP